LPSWQGFSYTPPVGGFTPPKNPNTPLGKYLEIPPAGGVRGKNILQMEIYIIVKSVADKSQKL